MCDNTTADSFANDMIAQNRSKSMDMRWWWLRSKKCKNIINIYWRPGVNCKADYYTKHHSGTHHQKVRPQYVANNAAGENVYGKYVDDHQNQVFPFQINYSDEGMLKFQSCQRIIGQSLSEQ